MAKALDKFFIYGPPGSGKSTIARLLAKTLALKCCDLDKEIENETRKTIPEIFSLEGEQGFRQLETETLKRVCQQSGMVIALGGGALIRPENRSLVENEGTIICLRATQDILLQRLRSDAIDRPLLGNGVSIENRLRELLAKRQEHYDSFDLQINTTHLSPQEVVWQVQIISGAFRVSGMNNASDVRVYPAGLSQLGHAMKTRNLNAPIALISDENVGSLYLDNVRQAIAQAGYHAATIIIPPGEQAKTIGTVIFLWDEFLKAGLERSSTIVALGGGVVTDLVGFAAATYLRGIRWVAVPTSLLGMTDASIGGKTAVDLPNGKNLVGAFHAPSLILVDPLVLDTLPQDELRNGMAEVIKHGVISDPALFEECAKMINTKVTLNPQNWSRLISKAMATKIRYVQEDPYEQGVRAALNFGHTIGHAVERASNYQLKHGEAVSIGMVAETRLAEILGIAHKGLAERIAVPLKTWGLPTSLPPSMTHEDFLPFMRVDKKKRDGRINFALPVEIGQIKTGVSLPPDELPLQEILQ